MFKNLLNRRLSFFIFLITLLSAIIFIKIDLNNSNKIYVQNKTLQLKIENIEKKNFKTYIYTKNAIISGMIEDDDFEIGDVIKITGKISNSLENKNKKYGYYLKSKGIDYSIYCYKIEKISNNPNFYTYISFIRKSILTSIDFIYPDYNSLVRALLISDREFITKDENLLFSRAGIIHIISVSGFHIVLVSTIIFNLLFFLPKNNRYIISSFLTLFYVFLTGFQAPCVRAYIFYLAYIFSIILEKRYDIFSIGFLLSSFYICLNPYILFDMGFCLSFISIYSISMFYSLINNFLLKTNFYLKINSKIKNLEIKNFFKNSVGLISVTLASQILTVPYVYYNFGIVSLITIFSNLISVPIISLSFPFMILSIIFIKIPILKNTFSNVVNGILFIFYKSNEYLTSFKFSYINFDNTNILFVCFYYVILFTLYFYYISLKIEKNKLSI